MDPIADAPVHTLELPHSLDGRTFPNHETFEIIGDDMDDFEMVGKFTDGSFIDDLAEKAFRTNDETIVDVIIA